ncbi:MAG: hypothetical protein ACTS5A_02810 [Candidatus Hodgkinia cicadicola]
MAQTIAGLTFNRNGRRSRESKAEVCVKRVTSPHDDIIWTGRALKFSKRTLSVAFAMRTMIECQRFGRLNRG